MNLFHWMAAEKKTGTSLFRVDSATRQLPKLINLHKNASTMSYELLKPQPFQLCACGPCQVFHKLFSCGQFGKCQRLRLSRPPQAISLPRFMQIECLSLPVSNNYMCIAPKLRNLPELLNFAALEYSDIIFIRRQLHRSGEQWLLQRSSFSSVGFLCTHQSLFLLIAPRVLFSVIPKFMNQVRRIRVHVYELLLFIFGFQQNNNKFH